MLPARVKQKLKSCQQEYFYEAIIFIDPTTQFQDLFYNVGKNLILLKVKMLQEVNALTCNAMKNVMLNKS